MTQRPDLVRAVSCDVPLLDMVRSEVIGIGDLWTREYGSAEVAEEFEALFAYSPYHVGEREGCREYPSVLFMSADSDDRVEPLHARKMAASLQELNSSDNPIPLYAEDGASHGGLASNAQAAETQADNTAFLMRETGLVYSGR